MIRIQTNRAYQSWMTRLGQFDTSTDFGRGAISVLASVAVQPGCATIPLRLLKSQGLASHPIHEVVASVSFSEFTDESSEFVHGIAFAELGFWKLCLEGDWTDMPEPQPTEEPTNRRLDGGNSALPAAAKEARRPHLSRPDEQHMVDAN